MWVQVTAVSNVRRAARMAIIARLPRIARAVTTTGTANLHHSVPTMARRRARRTARRMAATGAATETGVAAATGAAGAVAILAAVATMDMARTDHADPSC